jgi:uncharacterized protein
MGNEPRGFAGMDRETLRAISAKGGANAHANGRAHKWTSAEATAAGKKGGAASAVLQREKRRRERAERLTRG